MTILSEDDYVHHAMNHLGPNDPIIWALIRQKGKDVDRSSYSILFERLHSSVGARLIGFYRSSVSIHSDAGQAILYMNACGDQVEQLHSYDL
jgi:hypothetical protein